jgi:hypothetical protein
MSTDADLARWGEAPADPGEEELARILYQVLEGLRPGGDSKPASPLPHAPPLPANDGDLLRTLTWAQGLAAGIRDEHGTAEATTPLPDPFPGEFRLVRLLGEGSFGKVWLADDLHVGWQVALKLLKPPRDAGADALTALRNEARLLGSVRHPNVVQIHAVRRSGEDYYLVLQYVAGGSLAARLKEDGPLPWQKAARYVADVGEALLEVHARGIVHRDVNPANILWDADRDEAVLTDFGISCRLADPAAAAGTVPYLAPEAFEGSVTPALDVFSLAATLFRLATGAVPFPADSVIGHIGQVLDGLPDPDPRFAFLPPDLERLLRRALAAQPQRRPSLQEFVGALRTTLNQLLAQTILLPTAAAPGQAPVDLRLLVSKDLGDATYRPVAAVRPPEPVPPRDHQRVPPAPEQVRLRTGDRIRIQVRVDRVGYVTVFNVGPSGKLHVLWPAEAGDAAPPVEANRPFDVLDVEVTPPAGRERLVAAWTREPLPLEHVLRLTGQGAAVSEPYRATRDLERVQQSVWQRPRDDWHAVVLELDHEA